MAKVVLMQGTFYKIINNFGIFINRSFQVVDVRKVLEYEQNSYGINAPIFETTRSKEASDLYYQIYGQPVCTILSKRIMRN